MSVGFGFSAGDFIAALELVGTVIDALREAGGAGAQYRELINQLYILETALLKVKRVELDESQDGEKIALRQAVAQCQRTFDDFWTKASKYQPHLRQGGSSSRLKDSWMKIRWAVFQRKDLEKFKVDLMGHTNAIELLLMAVQMNTISLLGERQQRNHSTIAERIQKASDECIARFAAVASTFTSGVKQGRQILYLSMNIMRMNVRIFQIVMNIQDIIMRIPSQVERQQPVYMIDALGRPSPFHLEFIRSTEAFTAVLKETFRKIGSGSEKIERGEFAIQETGSKRDIDLNQDWDVCFQPGQRVDMSMIFVRMENLGTSCPSCNTAYEAPQNENEDIKCMCGMSFRRVVSIQDECTNSDEDDERLEFYISQQKGLKRKRFNSPSDDLRLFRRVRIMERPIVADFSAISTLISRSVLNQDGGPKIDNITLQCPKCSFSRRGNKLTVRMMFVRHAVAEHSNSLLVCRNDNCNETFFRSDNRARHEQNAHLAIKHSRYEPYEVDLKRYQERW